LAEFRNPNQQGGSGPGSQGGGSSLMMYFALTLVVFLGLQYFWGKHTQPAPAAKTQHAQSAAPTAFTPAAPPVHTVATAHASTSDANAVEAQTVTPITIDTPLYRITFSNRGGQVTSWILKKYKDLTTGKPLDLVNRQASAKFGYPLSLWTYQSALTKQLADALYVPSSTAATLTAPTALTFKYSSNGLQVTKTFSFNDSYVMDAKVSITQNGAPVSAGLAWPAGFGDQQSLPEFANSDFNLSQDGKVDQIEYKKVSGGKTLTGNFNWAGVSDLYFAAIFLPDHPQNASFVTLHNSIDVPANIKKPKDGETKPASILGAVANADNGTLECRLFVGPKTLQALNAVKGVNGGPSLSKVVSFGYTTVIAKPLFLILRWIHTHMVANWGWSILVLTLLLSILTLPTRISMMRSSLKMQRIQPQMDEIKQRYAKYKATDPKRQEMNQAVFKLQKDNGVNMFGSCLPMLIQWPLLFAFYRMLENVIELRQAHWLWISDLSAPDPYHILPIFFIVSMFLVQFLTPSPGVDKQQQRLMAFTMPAVFGFMTWSIASGLALYWAASNVLGILTQLGINQSKMGREMREMALRRAAKKKGKVINAKVVSARR
jgi:YidC/Oxa1 family membrane protein insertase